MIIKIGKKASAKSISKKLTKPLNSKKILWDKYIGKINFPVEALTYQRKMRDEWGK